MRAPVRAYMGTLSLVLPGLIFGLMIPALEDCLNQRSFLRKREIPANHQAVSHEEGLELDCQNLVQTLPADQWEFWVVTGPTGWWRCHLTPKGLPVGFPSFLVSARKSPECRAPFNPSPSHPALPPF